MASALGAVLQTSVGISGAEIASDLAAHAPVISAFRKSRYVIQKVAGRRPLRLAVVRAARPIDAEDVTCRQPVRCRRPGGLYARVGTYPGHLPVDVEVPHDNP